MYIAIDIGGTKTLLAVLSSDGEIKEQIKFATPSNYEEFLPALQDAQSKLSNSEFSQGAIGIRGLLDRDSGVMIEDDVLAWNNVPVARDARQIFGCDFNLENDSKLAGLSEAIALKDKFRKVLYLTISTGIGSAFILDGAIDDAVVNSEIGKSLYEHEGVVQPWEDFASGSAIVKKYGKRASEIDDPETWIAISKNLAPGIINACAAYTPDVIVVGGGVGAHYHKFEKQLLAAIQELPHDEISVPPIYQAGRPEEAVIYGCYELAKQSA